MSSDNWRDVSKSKPCPICESDTWCRVSKDGNGVTCKRNKSHPKYGDGKEKIDKSGVTCWTYRIGGVSNSIPPKHSHTEGTTNPATPEERDWVYRKFLELLPATGVCEELNRRSVSDDSPLRKQYKFLPIRGRAKVCRTLVEQGCESVMARTPGFFVQEKDGSKYWTCAGASGIVIPVRDHAGLITYLLIRPADASQGGKYKWFTSGGKGGAKCSQRLHFPKWAGDVETVRITEGILKADIATEFGGMLCVGFPGLYAKGLAKWVARKGVKTVRLAFDADAGENLNVARAIEANRKRLTRAGLTVELETWDKKDGKGIDDLLAAGKQPNIITGEAVAETIAKWKESAEAKQSGGRKPVTVGCHEASVTRDVVAALAEMDAGIYQKGSELVGVYFSPGPKPLPPTITPLTVSNIRNRITDAVKLCEQQGTNDPVEVNPPNWLPGAVKDLKDWPGIRPLVGIATAPILRPDGGIHQTPGYDAATALLYAPNCDFGTIPENPTRDQAKAAIEKLKAGVSEFPWQESSDLSAWLAEVLTVCVRPAIDGATPGFFHTSNTAGSGKTALAKATAWIATGYDLPNAPYPIHGKKDSRGEDVEELRKLATACAAESHQMFLLDNVPTGHVFGSSVMDAILTATTDAGRELGTSKSPRREARTVWTISGNNITPLADTNRRVIPVRLASPHERPAEVSFEGLDVEVWAKRNRRELFIAALTVAAAYITAGRPDAKTGQMGSFQEWSDLVRASLVWAGETDPCAAREAVFSEDTDRTTAIAVMKFLELVGVPAEGMSAAAIVNKVKDELCQRPEFPSVMVGTPIFDAYKTLFPNADKPHPKSLGYLLRRYRDRIVDGKKIERVSIDRDGIAFWGVRTMPSKQPSANHHPRGMRDIEKDTPSPITRVETDLFSSETEGMRGMGGINPNSQNGTGTAISSRTWRKVATMRFPSC